MFSCHVVSSCATYNVTSEIGSWGKGISKHLTAEGQVIPLVHILTIYIHEALIDSSTSHEHESAKPHNII